jgi:hypothetical protein
VRRTEVDIEELGKTRGFRARHLFLRSNDAKVIHGTAIPVYGAG